MNNSPVKSELYVALEMVELTQFLPFTKFKVIKRVAYGFRDLEYYILKLHQALSVDRESTLKACTL